MENYFNYFTEIEECFRKCRDTPTLLSTLDWALIESWKEAEIPLEAVLDGIERSFAKFQKRRRAFRKVNSLAYCSQAVFEAAEEISAARTQGGARSERREAAAPPFTSEEVCGYLNRNAEALKKASSNWLQNGQQVMAQDLSEAAAALREVAAQETSEITSDLEDLERCLTALEEKLAASLTRGSSVELLTQIRREVERGIAPYRRKMSAAQVESLERQFVKKRLREYYEIPRLSLFYL